MKLLIVESPTKANTIKKFLGKEYEAVSSYGHVRDLPKSKLGIEVENDFEPKYVIPTKARKRITLLKKDAAKAQKIILATDEDREGESIAWHIVQALGLNDAKTQTSNTKSYERIVFHEITKPAIEKALKNSRDIDINLVNAQQARRILDRLVGYKLSPFLWKKVFRGLSAGRVQSVALRFVAEREREIEKFSPQEYWTIKGLFGKRDFDSRAEKKEFEAWLDKKGGKKLDKLTIKNKAGAENILAELKGKDYKVACLEKMEIKKRALPPFTTSTLQQHGWQKFRWTAKLTMQTAQRLYEQGHITYHRTDSLNISLLAVDSARNHIERNLGKVYLPENPLKYKAKSKSAQEAHEAIRPTYPEITPDQLKANLQPRELKLYELIWRRFMACQMRPAIFDSTFAEIKAENAEYSFRASGQILKFEGFLKIYPLKYEEQNLPELKEKEPLDLLKLLPEQHFTKPPPRYNEASLIKVLEKEGIGRPSTYAPILSTIQDRNYVIKDEQKRFRPTEVGLMINDLLVEHFPEVVDTKFTANMEEELDEIAQGKLEWQKVLKAFYSSFSQRLEKKYSEVEKRSLIEETEKICPKCGSKLVIRMGRYGKFYACSNFPNCRHTEPMEQKTLGLTCPKCQKGEICPRRTKKGRIFYGCTNYPECDFALWDKPIGATCLECGLPMIQKGKKAVCSSKTCPTNQK